MSPKDCAYIVERLAVRFMSMVAEYERKLLEHRDAFGVRTSADAKIIDGMRAEVEDLRNRLNALGVQAAKQAGEALGMVEGEGLLGAARRVVQGARRTADTSAGPACRDRAAEVAVSQVQGRRQTGVAEAGSVAVLRHCDRHSTGV